MSKIKIILVLIFNFLTLIINAQETWSLEDCINYAIKNHSNMKQAVLDKGTALWQVKQAKAALLPDVNARVNHSYSLGSTINPNSNAREALNVQYDQLNVNVGIDLFNWENYLNIGLQKLNESSFVYQVENAKNQLKLEIIRNFYAYQNAKAWKDVLKSQLAGIDEQIRRTEKEVEIGVRSKSDIYDVKANMGNIQEQYIDAEKNERLTKISLLKTLELKDENIEFSITNNDLEPSMLLPNNLNDIIENQPIIKSLQKSIEAQEKRIKIAKSAALPTLVGQYQWSTFYSNVLGNSNDSAFKDQLNLNKNQYIGIGLNIPIFNKMQVKYQTRIAENEKESKSWELEQTKTALWAEINTILENVKKSIEKHQTIQQNFENQKLSYERSQEKFNEGLIDAYTFFMVRNNWFIANYNLIQSSNELMMQQELLNIFL